MNIDHTWAAPFLPENPAPSFRSPYAVEERRRRGACGPAHSADANHNPSPRHLDMQTLRNHLIWWIFSPSEDTFWDS